MKEITFKNYRLVCNKDNEKAELAFFANDRLVWKIRPALSADYYPLFKAFGNKVYSDCKRNPALLSSLFSRILDYSILCEDYDSYSDGYKDEFCTRPHLTNAEWKKLVKDTKAEYGI